MNPVLQEFIAKAKTEKQRQKEQHLISLGLIDKGKTTREYNNYYDLKRFPNYDQKSGKYYNDMIYPIDITDEEYEELLKWLPKKNKVESNVSKYSGSIEGLAIVYLILSLIAGVICCLIETHFILIGIALIISGFISYIFFRGFANVVAAAEKYLSK